MTDELGPYVIKANPGTILFSEGDQGDEMYFVHSGKVRIEKKVDNEIQVFAVMEKGDFFGEMSVLEPLPRTATAVVEEEATLLRVNSQNFEKILSGNIEIAVRMIRKYAARLRETNDKLEKALKDGKELGKGIQNIIESVRPQAAPNSKDVLAEFVGTNGANQFKVLKHEISIGRKDPVTQIVPDIDLTELDKTRSVSRRHAKLQYVSGQFLLYEEIGVQNGTFVNGTRMTPGAPITLINNTKVSFGAVEFVFQSHPHG